MLITTRCRKVDVVAVMMLCKSMEWLLYDNGYGHERFRYLKNYWWYCASIFSASSNRSTRPEVFCKKKVLRNFAKFTEKHLCQNLFLIICRPLSLNFIKKETLAQVFSCELKSTSGGCFCSNIFLDSVGFYGARIN